MATRAAFDKLAQHLHEFGKGSHIFFKKGFWQM